MFPQVRKAQKQKRFISGILSTKTFQMKQFVPSPQVKPYELRAVYMPWGFCVVSDISVAGINGASLIGWVRPRFNPQKSARSVRPGSFAMSTAMEVLSTEVHLVLGVCGPVTPGCARSMMPGTSAMSTSIALWATLVHPMCAGCGPAHSNAIYTKSIYLVYEILKFQNKFSGNILIK